MQYDKNKIMNSQTRRAPGFIYRANVLTNQNPSFSSHQQANPSESQFEQEQYTPIDSLQDDLEEYLEAIKDPQEEQALAKKPLKVDKQQLSYLLPSQAKSYQVNCLNKLNASKVTWGYDKNFRHNQKQHPSLESKLVSKIMDKKGSRQMVKKSCKNPEVEKINENEPTHYDPESAPVLAPQKQLTQPYFQYTYAEEARENLLEEEKQQTKPTSMIVGSKYVDDNKIRDEEKTDIIRLLFDKVIGEKEINEIFQSGLCQLNQSDKCLQPFKLVDFMHQTISSSIPKLVKELLLLKHLQNCISIISKRDKTHKLNSSHSSFSMKVLDQMKQVTKQLQSIQLYEGIHGIFTTNTKLEQIKRFLVFVRFSMIVIIYITVINKFQQYKNYLLNLVKFLIENHLILLNNIISSKNLTLLIHRHYPLLNKKSLDLIKVNNDSINQVILKLSVFDDLFFSSLNKLAKRTATFTFGQIFKEFLEFLAFYLHKNSLQTKASIFSTAPSPFLKLNPSQYHLIIDATHFTLKDKKGNFSFRPFSQNFLKQISQHFHLINYSSISPKQSKTLLTKFDKHNLIKHQLYSHHFETWPQFRRCIERISSNPNNLVYLNCEQNQPSLERIISLKKWKGDKKDRQLIDILPILISIPHMKLDCYQVTQALQNCHFDIGKMQEALLPILKKVNKH